MFRIRHYHAAVVLAAAVVGAGPVLAQDGEVIASASFDVTSDQYLVWNEGTCMFEPAEGPGGYVAEVRRAEEPLHIVFTPEEQTNAVFVSEAKRLVELGEQAGVEVTVLDNAFPDTMRPLQNADQAVTMGVDVVLSQLILPDLNPAVQTKMAFVLLAGVNMVLFYWLAHRELMALGPGEPSPPRARFFTLVSLLAWTGVIACGRLITFYRPPFFWCFWCGT